MMNFASHLLARFPGDYEDLLIHTAGSLVGVLTIRMMAAKIEAGNRDYVSMILTRHFAVAVDFVRQIERLPMLLVVTAVVVLRLVAALVDSDCDASVVFPCN